MRTKTWNDCYSSICSIIYKNDGGEQIGSGTGFKINEYLITNNHVFIADGASTVEIKFVENNGSSIFAIKEEPYYIFQNRLIIGDPETGWDYAILKLDDIEFSEIPSLELDSEFIPQIGSQIAVLGFQFDQNNLSIKQGILSSRFIRAGVKYLQIDANINNGNSGGPLFDLTTNKVIGVVTRKHTGLSAAFDSLIKSNKSNITLLTAAKAIGSAEFMGVNFVETLLEGQIQMQTAVKEIKRSANVGIGYAYELDQILDFFRNL